MLEESSDLWASALATLSVEDQQCIAFEGQNKLDVLTDLQNLSDAAKDSSVKNRWHFRRRGRGGEDETVVVRDLFSKIVVWIDRFREVVDVVVQYDPAHTALPWAGVRFLLQIATSDFKKFDFVVEGAEVIARSIPRFAIFEDLYLHRINLATKLIKSLEEALIRLYGAIFQYLAKAKKYFEQSTAKRALGALVNPQEEFEEIIRGIASEQSSVDRYASLADAENRSGISDSLREISIVQGERHAELRSLLESIDGPICRMSNQLENIEDHLDERERVSILRWLSEQPYESHHQQVKKQALKGSGQWLLQDPVYAEWHKASVSSLLWLHGKPGSGKSTLVSIVIEDVIERFGAGQSPLPVYFYCSRSAAETERSNPDTVIASILRQLSCAQIGKGLPSLVVDKYTKQGQGFKSHGLPLEESLELVIELVGFYGMTIIVVDALDECEPEMRQSLLDAFEDILRESAGLVKIFVSSRDDQDIVCTLRGYPNMNISSDKNTTDIEVFVEKETQRLVHKQRILRNSRAKVEMQALIIDQVSKGADGMFRWASLQLEVLCALKLDEDIRGKLGKLPPKLEQLYLEVYNELSSYQGDAGRSIIDNALKWLLCAQRTLHTSEFLWAVAVDLDIAFKDVTRDLALDLCHNFILYDEGLDMFRFAHLSVREFLEKSPEFYRIPCNLLAAESCLLQIIGSSDCSPDTNLYRSDEHVTRLQGTSALRTESVSRNFLAYANAEWMNHCKLIPQNVRSDHSRLGRLLQSFLDEDSGLVLAFYAWVRWYCSRMLGTDSPIAALQLQTLLGEHSRPPSRSFFVAIAYGFIEVVTLCIRKRAIENQEKGKGLVLAAMATDHEVFDLLVNSERDWELTEPILFYAIQDSDNERLAWLLDKSTHLNLTTRIIAAVGKNPNGGSMALLLQKYPGSVITEHMLETSVLSANKDSFKLLLARATNKVLTRNLVCSALYNDQEDKWSLLRDRIRPFDVSTSTSVPAARTSVPAARTSVPAARCHHGFVKAELAGGGYAHLATKSMACVVKESDTEELQLVIDRGAAITPELLVAMAGKTPDVLRVLLESGCVVDGKVLRLQAGNSWNVDILATMLDHEDKAIAAAEIATLMFEVAGSLHLDSTMRQLLDRAQLINVPEDVLFAAACNCYRGSGFMQLFLEQDQTSEITAELLICAMGNLELDVVVQLLDRVEVKGIIHELLAAAAENLGSGGRLVRLLLNSADITEIPDVVLDNAIGNVSSGKEVIQALEEAFGPIEVTEDVMLKVISQVAGRTGLPSGANYLFDPALITDSIFLSTMSIDPPRYKDETKPNIRYVVAENALHLPITLDILKTAARYCDVDCFRFLWNRGGMAKIARDVMQAAAKNSCDGYKIVLFLLDHIEHVEIREEVMLAIVGNRLRSTELLNLLWDRGYILLVTHDVLRTAIANVNFEEHDLWGLTCLLEHFSPEEVTEDLFKTAATAGNEDFLHQLSGFCHEENPAEKWLDIARLHRAAAFGDNDTLKNILERGVRPEVAQLECSIPIERAYERCHVSAIQMLLSAGAAPDALIDGRTPLFRAAERGQLEMVKVLANAGASLDFGGIPVYHGFHGRYTPYTIAKKAGRIRVFRFLEQFKKTQDLERKASAANSTQERQPIQL